MEWRRETDEARWSIDTRDNPSTPERALPCREAEEPHLTKPRRLIDVPTT
jgi:hypothetical protein